MLRRIVAARHYDLAPRLGRGLPWLAAAVALVLYASAAAPGIVTFFDDSLEFQVVGPTLGIAHPTGYPLYTLMGFVWTHLLSWGTWAGRMNLLSAAAAAATVGLVAALGSRLSSRPDGRPNPWAGAAAAASLGLGPIWWGQATVAEVYALHGLVTAAILATTAGMDQALAHSTVSFDRRMTRLGLLFGLGLAHHRMTLLLAVPVAVYLVWRVPKILQPRRVWWRWTMALVAPLLLYLYLPLRAAMGVRDLHGSYVPSWSGFWDHVLARGYTVFFAANPLAVTRTPQAWFGLFTEQIGWIGVVLVLAGLARIATDRRRPNAAWAMVVLVFVVQTAFVLVYRVPDPDVFLVPALIALALLIGGGGGLIPWLLRGPTGTAAQAVLLITLVAAPMGRGPWLDRSRDWTWHDQARRLAAADFPAGSLVLGIEGEMTAIRYMQAAENRGLDANPVAADDPDRRRQLLEQAVDAGRPVYLTRELAGIGADYSFGGDAALVRVWPRGMMPAVAMPSMPATPVDNGDLLIEAYHLTADPYATLPGLELTLYWRALQPLARVLKLSLRVVDGTGQPVTAASGAPLVADVFPLHQVSLTPEWVPGEVIRDVHYIVLEPSHSGEAPDRTASDLLVVVYNAEDVAEVGRLRIPLPAQP